MATDATKDSVMGAFLDLNAGLAKLFQKVDWHCLQCPSNRRKHIAQTCHAYCA